MNAAALAEYRLGAAEGQDPAIYLTVGTGIGGGAVVNGKLLHGAAHPEMGHMLMSRRGDDAFPGSCPFHGSCWEGLASGPAVEARWGRRGEDLPPGHPAWDLEAWYLAQGIVNLLMVLSPRAVILGGGISQVPGLIDQGTVRGRFPVRRLPGSPRTPAEWASDDSGTGFEDSGTDRSLPAGGGRRWTPRPPRRNRPGGPSNDSARSASNYFNADKAVRRRSTPLRHSSVEQE
ncbi:MAG: ROK family protein [Candidatus Moduliflexus flocculans]|nr:ROK family protein [Candidatus Moduliflexus flocculans]